MASKSAVRAFFKVSGLDENYYQCAKSILTDMAEAADEELDEEDCKAIGDRFVELWVGVYAASFDDLEMADLIFQHQKPVFRKLVKIEADNTAEVHSFLTKEVLAVLGIDEEMLVASPPVH